jgi:hypothetical protein
LLSGNSLREKSISPKISLIPVTRVNTRNTCGDKCF